MHVVIFKFGSFGELNLYKKTQIIFGSVLHSETVVQHLRCIRIHTSDHGLVGNTPILLGEIATSLSTSDLII